MYNTAALDVYTGNVQYVEETRIKPYCELATSSHSAQDLLPYAKQKPSNTTEFLSSATSFCKNEPVWSSACAQYNNMSCLH